MAPFLQKVGISFSLCTPTLSLEIYFVSGADSWLYFKPSSLSSTTNIIDLGVGEIENTSWKVLAYGIYARVVDVSEIERVSAANE